MRNIEKKIGENKMMAFAAAASKRKRMKNFLISDFNGFRFVKIY